MGLNDRQSLNYYERRILSLINNVEALKGTVLDILLHQPEGIEPPDKNVAKVLHWTGTAINFVKIPAMALPNSAEKTALPDIMSLVEDITKNVIKGQVEFIKKHGPNPNMAKAEDIKPVDIDELFINLSKKASDDNGKDS